MTRAIETAAPEQPWADWLPVATAPRDGTRCLFFQGANKRAGHPRARREDWVVDAFCPLWPRAHHQLPEAPYTHWIPLPASPKAAQ